MAERIALITGGSRGIGAAIAEALAADGYDVAFSFASNAGRAAEVADIIRAKGRRALAIQADGSTIDGNRAVVAQTVAAFGRIDALVCNAGTYPYGLIETMTVEDIDRALTLNVRAVMVETAEAVKHMREGGRLIYIGSAFGERSPFPGISVYSATKAALPGFARGVARDLGPRGITANVVQPGPIDTELNPADGQAADVLRSFVATGAYGTVGDIAGAVSFLASPASRYVTGTVLTVDGGLCA
ncbi:oxidoreductase [Neoasaia chiangmaiensis NBRC 101099]|uniref:Oxidoreductase n=1 Tax=Neoasaia chiangmaiensis TaxID=320497 RepID=A0A1U9KN91_9PROT|nr:SDR family oxidoreductase [Neoasaia chiangmaiensis]AQS87238.1 oxidoreductase [Neoasaia chiangmaiensis]GBR38418.1 oxidoreductase [Neoasaia chiangmaiensis NBRC 101099]GEN15904.1 3-oxoacyl-ACP reductase [Neoasaia chiangmaiensis]